MNTALVFLLIALGAEVEPAETQATESGEYVAGIAAGRVWDQDVAGRPDLRGYRVAFTAFSRGSSSGHGHAGSWYVEWKDSRQQETLEVGVELAYPYFRLSRVGLGPRFRLAVHERAEPPHRGTDAVFGVGFDLGLWLSEGVQIAVLADRSVGLETGTRTSYSMNLRVMFWAD